MPALFPVEKCARIWRLGLFGLLAAVPFSVEFWFSKSSKISLPTEPLIAVLAVAGAFLFFKIEKNEQLEKLRFLKKSAVQWLAVGWLIWMFWGIFFSSRPVVSIKFWAVEAAHFWVFFVLPLLFFDEKSWLRARQILAASMAAAAVWSLVRHGFFFDFRADQSSLAPQPFFADHAIFSAAASLVFFFFLDRKMFATRSLSMSYAFLLLAAIAFSFCRAAWLAVAAAVFLGFVFLAKRHFSMQKKWAALGGLILLAGFVFFQKRETEKTVLPDGNSKNALDQIRSISNLQTDASNLERLNRWRCAGRMFLEKPVFGWGAGTFQFEYLPFQKEAEMTRISVRSTGPHEQGRGGGAHSEPLKNLAENGLLGFVFWLFLSFWPIFLGFRLFQKTGDRAALGIALGLLTWFLHSFFNDFFHSEKVAAIVWLLFAELVFRIKNDCQTN